MDIKTLNQIVVPGKLFVSKGGSEIIQFSVQLGPFYLKCDVTVPDEGTEMGPVYIKCGLRDMSRDEPVRGVGTGVEVVRRGKSRAA